MRLGHAADFALEQEAIVAETARPTALGLFRNRIKAFGDVISDAVRALAEFDSSGAKAPPMTACSTTKRV